MALDDSEMVGSCYQVGNGIGRLAALASAGDEQPVVEQFQRTATGWFHSSAVESIKSIRMTEKPDLPRGPLTPMAEPSQTDARPTRCLRRRFRVAGDGAFEFVGEGVVSEAMPEDLNPLDLRPGFCGLDLDDRLLDRNVPTPIWRDGVGENCSWDGSRRGMAP